MKLPVSRVGVKMETSTALADAKWMIDERGDLIIYYSRTETTVGRDKYNSIKKKTIVTGIEMYAYPINFNPVNEELRKAGLREMVDVIVYTAMKDWTDNDLNPENDIDHTRDTVVLRGKTYKIKNTGLVNHFSNMYLNVTIGLALR